MASCKTQTDCGPQEACVDGQCVSVESPKPREVRRTFTTAMGEYSGEIAVEQKKLKEFGEFLTEQLDEAADKRKEEAESSDFWGQVLSIGGSIAGFFLGASNPVLWATIGSSIGSIGGRFGADILDPDAEKYGLDDAELAKLSGDDLKYLKGTHEQLVNDAIKAQEDLDAFDDNQWKQHVKGVIGDTWNAYKMASFGKGLGVDKLFQGDDVVDIADTANTGFDLSNSSMYQLPEIDIDTALDEPAGSYT